MHTASKSGRKPMTPAVRKALIDLKSATKAEICEQTGISFPTISKLLAEMVEEGEVLSIGLDQSSGGRPAERYAYNAEYRWGLAIYLEKEETKYIIFDCFGKVKRWGHAPNFLTEGGIHSLTAFLEKTIAETASPIKAITIGVPGAVDKGHIIYMPGYESFHGFDLQTYYEAYFSMPVVVENDMNAAVLGYHKRRNIAADQSLVYLYSGHNGPGAGIMINGDLVRGSTLFAGEISFVPQYDERSFGQVVAEQSSIDSEERVDSFSRMVATFTAIINPDTIILSSDEMEMGMVARIAHRSSRYIPAKHLPKLTLSNWEQDYLYGLRKLCLDAIVNLHV